MKRATPVGTSPTGFEHLFHVGRRRAGITLLFSCVALAFTLLLAVTLSPEDIPISPVTVLRVLGSHLHVSEAAAASAPNRVPSDGSLSTTEADAIVWSIRAPRAVLAALVGSLLALAGVALQGLLMNPLADPYTVGVSSGAALGAAIAELAGIGGLWFGYARMGVAFGFALLAVSLVYLLARVGGRVSANTFLLAGVVVGTLLASFVPLLLALAHRASDLSRLLFYLIGSLTGADWTRVQVLLPFLVSASLLLWIWSRELNLMTLGEESAVHLGVDIESVKRRVLIIGSLITAAAVAVAGIIGFVGLVVPHGARRITGPDHRLLIPLSAILGATLMVASDTLARVYFNEVQVGVVTSLIGAPVFCYLLRTRLLRQA